jgi:hypothetical protein
MQKRTLHPYLAAINRILISQVPVMVRVEVEKTQHLQLQVTIATPDVTVTSSVKDVLVQSLLRL